MNDEEEWRRNGPHVPPLVNCFQACPIQLPLTPPTLSPKTYISVGDLQQVAIVSAYTIRSKGTARAAITSMPTTHFQLRAICAKTQFVRFCPVRTKSYARTESYRAA